MLCRASAVCAAILVLAGPGRLAPERITPSTVGRLSVAWTYDTRESTDPVRPGTKAPALEATPIYVEGRLYLSTPRGSVIALDAETGAEVWRTDLHIRKDAN